MALVGRRRENYLHREFNRLEFADQRRRQSPYRPSPPRLDHNIHGRNLNQQVQQVQQFRRTRNYPAEVREDLIFIVEESGDQRILSDTDFTNINLTPLFHRNNGIYVLFASDGAAVEFQRRLIIYQNWDPAQRKRANQTNPSYAPLFARIGRIRPITPEDRIGHSLRNEYLARTLPEPFDIFVNFWFLGNDRTLALFQQVQTLVQNHRGEITGRCSAFRTATMTIRTNFELLEEILQLDQVYQVNLIRTTSPDRLNLRYTTHSDIERIAFNTPPTNAPYLCLIDTGVIRTHPALNMVVVEERKFGLLPDVPDADEDGHGTENAGIAVYGDIEACLQQNVFNPQCRLLSAKISRELRLQNYSDLGNAIQNAGSIQNN